MISLNIPETEDTPKVHLDPANGIFEISRRSYPEDATGFYAPVMEWLGQYTAAPNPETSFSFRLEYFNTASAKQLFKILTLLEDLSRLNKVTIVWHYNKQDQDMLASGMRYSKMISLEMQMVEH